MPDGYLHDGYAEKDPAYYASARKDYVARLPAAPAARILELGCGNGATGALALAEGKCGLYVGIEMFEPMAAQAEQVLTRVLVGDVAKIDLDFPPDYFDVLICSEVLEHLVDPEAVLRKLIPHLKIGGLVLASSPNIAHYSVVLNLLRARFDYAGSGNMDRTHLRWFTPTSYCRLFEESGVRTTHVRRLSLGSRLIRALVGLVPGPFGHLLWYQIDFEGTRVR